MKLLIFIFILISSSFRAIAQCPQQVTVSIQCQNSNRNLQFLYHLGIYNHPRMELDQKNNLMICSYNCKTWTSRYRYSDQTIRVNSLAGLSHIVDLINSLGFKVDHFGYNSEPFAILVFKPTNKNLTLRQMFLFSGLESTFDNDSNFSVDAFDKKNFSTIVINERYLKSQNAAADTFETGSNCNVAIK